MEPRTPRISVRLSLLGIPVILLIAVLGGVFARQSYVETRDDRRDNIAILAATAATNLDNLIDSRFVALEGVGELRAFATGRPESIAPVLADVARGSTDFGAGFGWIDAEGAVRASSAFALGNQTVSVADRDYFRLAFSQRRRALEVLVGRISGDPRVVLAVPTRDGSDRPNGVLSGSFTLASLARLSSGLTADRADIRVIDAAGRLIIGGPDGQLRQVDPRSPYSAMRAESEGVINARIGLTGAPDRIVGFATMPSTGWLVALSYPRQEVLGAARRSLVIELGTLGVATLLGSIGLMLGARSMHRRQRDNARRHATAERLRGVANELIGATTLSAVGDIACKSVGVEARTMWCAVIECPADGAPGPPRIIGGTKPDSVPIGALTRNAAEARTINIVAADRPDSETTPAGWAPYILLGPIGGATATPRFLAAGVATPSLDEVERGAIAAVLEDAAQAYERAELIERENRSRTRAELLATAGAAIDQATDVQGRAEQLVEALVPAFADFATLEAEEDDGTIRVVAARHREPAKLQALLTLRSEHRTPRGAAVGIAKLLNDGQPQLIPSVPEQRLVSVPEGAGPLLDELAPASYLGVPLRSGHRTVAGLLLARRRGRPPFDQEDLTFATSIADRAGGAIERARLFTQQRAIALELQQTLLSTPPNAFGDQVRIAMRYRPAEREMYVGGDWYDAIALPDGTIGLAVGDVVGHGLGAAAAMGKLASALRAIALSTTAPDEVLAQLERFADQTEGARLATVAYCVLDPVTGLLRFSIAGHPPPLVMSSDGRVEMIWTGRGGPLAVSSPGDRRSAEVTLEAGSTLILYSDGLFERRGEVLDDSLQRLADSVARQVAVTDPQGLVDNVLSELQSGQPRADDVVILAARLDHLGRRLDRTFPAAPSALVEMRAMVRAWLRESRVLDDLQIEGALLAFGEAASNAVEHAYPADAPGAVDVRLDEDHTRVSIAVHDHGRWRDPPAPGLRGRGLNIISRLVDDIVVNTDETGTSVTIEMAATLPTGNT